MKFTQIFKIGRKQNKNESDSSQSAFDQEDLLATLEVNRARYLCERIMFAEALEMDSDSEHGEKRRKHSHLRTEASKRMARRSRANTTAIVVD